jgi:N4-(beta-N-acetylglucosaminyl)-L-asparaginase
MNPTLRLCAIWLALCFCVGSCAHNQAMHSKTTDGPVLIATWPFGQQATDLALQTLEQGGDSLDAIEQGIRLIEHLGSDGSVGLAGRPNAAGYSQLDACIMSGPDHGAGSVAALEGIKHPISAARLVMEKNPHVMLVGEGARWFALEHGLESIDVSDLPAKKLDWEQARLSGAPAPSPGERGHDTIGVLLRDTDGNLYGGCSTSGAGGKTPGRVGDSPILGSGLYVDNAVGAAAGTGLGENIMRYSATALIVELMRQGLTPQAACEEMVHRIAATDPLGYDLSICFIAVNKQGQTGAACSNDTFPFAITTRQESVVHRINAVTPR